MAFAFDQDGSKAWIPRRCSVGARFSITGCSLITSSRMSHHRRTGFDFLLRRLDGGRDAHGFEAREDEGLEQLEAISFGGRTGAA
jgi:hypothetical protein